MMVRHIAVAVLKTGHRSHCERRRLLRSPLDEPRAGALTPDCELLASILYYSEEFTNRIHHPKEEQILFSASEGCAGRLPPLLDILCVEHRESPGHSRGLRRLLRPVFHSNAVIQGVPMNHFFDPRCRCRGKPVAHSGRGLPAACPSLPEWRVGRCGGVR